MQSRPLGRYTIELNARDQKIKKLESQNAKLREALEACENFLTSFDPRQPSIIPIATGLAKFIGQSIEGKN